MKFRKKPVVVEAEQLTEENWRAVFALISGAKGNMKNYSLHPDGTLTIKTLGGEMTANPNDWIIRGINGEFHPCKPDIFEKTYEAAQ